MGKLKATIRLTFNDGESIFAWETMSVRENYTDPLGSYSFTARPPREQIEEYDGRLQKGDLIKIYFNEQLQATPIITTREVTVGQGGVSFKIDCKSQLVTLAEGSIDPGAHQAVKSEVAISELIDKAVSLYGFAVVQSDVLADVVAKAGGQASTKLKFTHGDTQPGTTLEEKFPITKTSVIDVKQAKDKDTQAQHGESVLDYLSRILAKHGVAIHANAFGYILLSKPDYKQDALYTLVQDRDFSHAGDRMIDDIVAMDSNDGLYSEVVLEGVSADREGDKRANKPSFRVGVKGSSHPINAPYLKTPKATVAAGRHMYRSTATTAKYKPKFIHSKNATSVVRCESLCHLIMGGTSYKGFSLRATVDGFVSVDGSIWTINTVAKAIVQAIHIDEQLWILERSMSADRGGGQKTSMVLIPLNSLVLEQPQL